jgi:SAM-dependent methyltransferase
MFQVVLGAHSFRKNCVETYIKPSEGMGILDIGCGPAEILAYLPNVFYVGFDISENYIKRARARFGHQGKFYCKELQLTDLKMFPQFDVVLALGVLHHLDDNVAIEMMSLGAQALKPGGKLLSVDACLDPSQNKISQYLVRKDRGQNVRDSAGYEALAQISFEEINVEVKHQRWFPYTRCFMECKQSCVIPSKLKKAES